MASAGLLIAAVLATIAALVIPYSQLFKSAAILLCCGAAISFMLSLYWAHERMHFFWTIGKCEVLRLLGSVESFRTCSAIVPAICQAIEEAQSTNTDNRQLYLREEMREHYRLRRANAITGETCGIATHRTLSKFD